MLKTLLSVCLVVVSWVLDAQAGAVEEATILYLKQVEVLQPVLSNMEEIPLDKGLAGARLAIVDANTTGRFLNQHYTLKEMVFDANTSPDIVVDVIRNTSISFVILDLPSKTLEAVIRAGITDRLMFNVGSSDNHFRDALCQSNLLHTLPSRAMITDALTQYLVKKRWVDWFIIEGSKSVDRLYSESLLKSAKKFGAKIVEHRTWDGGRDARRTAQAEVPRLTQSVDYDVLMVADEWGDFGEYLMYRTWDPRPVAGTQGLYASGWYWTVEQWGAAQLQRRFTRLSTRRMGARDYAAWAAMRSISEAAMRTNSLDYAKISNYIQSDQFELAAYKGRKLSYRSWSGQLRQPIPVTSARSLVSQSPQEGYLHRVSELDTLGFDKSEVRCQRN
ncbi:MAG: ABC transporter substrate-binding protein [Gammaproteobacteria bacterium]|nr:ABC transporter substrate-binding protein [Gammaproteobacteria bacterium]